MSQVSVDTFVDRIDERHGVSKRGPWTMYTLVGSDGSKVKAGFNPPSLKVGDMLRGNGTLNKFGEVEDFKPGTPASPPAPVTGARQPTARGRAPSRGAGGFPVDKRDGQQAIMRQNALTNAVNLFTSRESSTTDTEDAVEEILDIAYKFVEFSSGQRDVRLAKEAAALSNQANAEMEEFLG